MKDLIVYFSLEGKTEYVVNKIKEINNADVLKLVPKKAYSDKGFSKFLWGGKSAVMGEKPKLEEYTVDLDAYDRIILGFPVWASTFTPPLRTFICDNIDTIKNKRIAAFACQGGSGAEKALTKLAECIGIKEFEDKAVFIDPKARHTEDTDKAIEIFANNLKDRV